MSKVLVMVDANNDSEPAEVWRLDQPGEGDRFFRHVADNCDVGDTFTFKALTQKQWKDCQRFGEQMA